jgi:hypothetical protein
MPPNGKSGAVHVGWLMNTMPVSIRVIGRANSSHRACMIVAALPVTAARSAKLFARQLPKQAAAVASALST